MHASQMQAAWVNRSARSILLLQTMPAIRGGPPAHTIAASGCVNAITGAVTEHHAVFTNYTALTLIDDHPLDLWHAIKHPLKLDPVSAAQAPETTQPQFHSQAPARTR